MVTWTLARILVLDANLSSIICMFARLKFRSKTSTAAILSPALMTSSFTTDASSLDPGDALRSKILGG